MRLLPQKRAPHRSARAAHTRLPKRRRAHTTHNPPPKRASFWLVSRLSPGSGPAAVEAVRPVVVAEVGLEVVAVLPVGAQAAQVVEGAVVRPAVQAAPA